MSAQWRWIGAVEGGQTGRPRSDAANDFNSAFIKFSNLSHKFYYFWSYCA